MKEIKVGQKVFWHDPAGETSAIFTVVKNGLEGMTEQKIKYYKESIDAGEDDDRIVLLSNESGGKTEAYPCELSEVIRVHFRKWRDSGTIIALFPDEINDPETHITSYEHVGQHGSADYHHVLSGSIEPVMAECRELLKELTSIGYDNLWIINNSKLNQLSETVKTTRETILAEMYAYVQMMGGEITKEDMCFPVSDENSDKCELIGFENIDGKVNALIEYKGVIGGHRIPVMDLSVEHLFECFLLLIKE